MNRTTVAMGAIFLALTVVGAALLWLAIALGAWHGIIISLAWTAFTGSGTIFAWRIRYEA